MRRTCRGRPTLRILASVLLIWLPAGATAQRNLAGSPIASAEERVALVIGNGAYRHVSPLANPPNDARLVADTLVSLGFHLVGDNVLLDADRPAMERAIRAFGKRLRAGAVGLFYYAGHGVQVSGENYLIPVTANVSDAADVKYELVSVGYVLDEMSNAGNRLNIVVLDACRNNPFGGRGLRSDVHGLAQVTAPAGTVISYATQPGNTAADGDGKHSPFTLALAAAMKKPGLGVFETFNDVGLVVKSETGGRQQPWLASSPIEGVFQFRGTSEAAQTASSGASVPKPDSIAEIAASDRVFWESVKDSKQSAEFEAYLERFPNGTYAALAKARLDTLRSTAAPPLAAPAVAEAEPHATLFRAATSARRIGDKTYDPLPALTEVKVYSSERDVGQPFTVVAMLSHVDAGKFHIRSLQDAIEPLSQKARQVGANGIIIDKSERTKSGIVSTGISVEARAIRLNAQP